ncbi:MAG: sugar phosphate isomerase/epimerase family protein [Kiritimatiellia bacterium]
MNRRKFLFTLAAAGAAGALRARPQTADVPFRTQLRKALIRPRLTPAVVADLRQAGFPGIELHDKTVTVAEARATLRLAQENGLNIHSFMGGWLEFNSKDAAKRREAIETGKRNIEIAEAYGAPVMLIVPGRVGGIEMPKPSQFDLEFDAKTLELRRATADGGFADYVVAQNDATRFAQDALGELAPHAAEHGVILGVENVWNNLWVKPEFASAFIRSFENPWIKSYLDLGNHVRYAPVERWLAALGDQIVRLHIKDFKIDRAAANEGAFVRLGEGSIDWKRVRRAIEAIGYNGWVSIEESGWTDAEYAGIMDRFFAGRF